MARLRVVVNTAIDTAPESAVRAVLRALCAEDDALMGRIAGAFDKLPPNVESESCETEYEYDPAVEDEALSIINISDGEESDSSTISATMEEEPTRANGESSRQSQKRKAVEKQVCVRCGMELEDEEGVKSLTCLYHPYDMELDLTARSWRHYGYGRKFENTPYWRDLNPAGFTYPCCGFLGKESIPPGCTKGKHWAADGKRGKYDDKDASEAQKENIRQFKETQLAVARNRELGVPTHLQTAQRCIQTRSTQI
ncbi:hypothetical protein B0T20DRAFT_405291 [Sordaria brevicollis]|uniref:Uncharacterized protein n=1 Tax=Sordaria brevicollis TaxID=83679 RepID=A0AAE0PIW4_SORBR|nr:hypothetical protein B0T20DRAFT_405291 [Sordaria brevicollis]